MDSQHQCTVAASIASTLKDAGVDKLFLLTGGDQPLWIALRDAGIRMVVGRSEPSAVYMADGYARASGTVGVTYGQAGPGAANVAAALADAHWAQSPVFALTGATATDALQAYEYQDIDQYAMFAPVTKWNGRVAEPQQTAGLVRQAIEAALSRSQGPTHLDVPKNYFGLTVDKGAAPKLPALTRAQTDASGPAAEIIAALRKARSPVILVGEGVRFADAGAEVGEVAAAAGVPILATMGGKPAILSGHPNFCGVVGRYSAVTANQMLGDADVVLALGTRLGGLATNGYKLPRPRVQVIQVDHEASSFVGRYEADVRVLADVRDVLAALRDALQQSGPVGDPAWLASCREATSAWKQNFVVEVDKAAKAPDLSPLVVLKELGEVAREITLVADTGYMAAWTGVLFPIERTNGFFRAVGSLGWALPASIGVQLARKEKVVCVTGDGGAGYHLSDIETAVRYSAPVIIIILDNQSLAFEYHEQKYRWGGNVISEANDFGPVDFAVAAQALGAQAFSVTNREQFKRALAQALAAQGPCVIHARVDKEAFPPVTNFDAHMARTI